MTVRIIKPVAAFGHGVDLSDGGQRGQKLKRIVALVVYVNELARVLGLVRRGYRRAVVRELNLRVLFVAHRRADGVQLSRIRKIVFCGKVTVVGQSLRLAENFRKFVIISGNDTLIDGSFVGLHDNRADA